MIEFPAPPARAALVTGGARRIGAAICGALARAGYGIAIHARDSAAAAHDLANTIIAKGGRATVVEADLADHAQAKDLIAAARAALGPLTLLVNSASLFERDEIGALDHALWERQFAVNLAAPVFLTEAFAAQIPDGPDCAVINLTDQRVLNPTAHFVSYTLSKCALHVATRTLALALAPNIRVNAVAPGPTLPSPRQSEQTFARQAASVPLGHGPSPEEIAEAVLYLAQARSVTGQTLVVDGGQHLGWRRSNPAEIEE